MSEFVTDLYSVKSIIPTKKAHFAQSWVMLCRVIQAQNIVKIATYLLLWLITNCKICKSFLCVSVLANEFKRLRVVHSE